MDIVFALDSSFSIKDVNWRTMIRFVESKVRQFDVKSSKTRVGIVYFSNIAVQYISPSEAEGGDSNLIRDKLDNLKDIYQHNVSPDNNTQTDKALDAVINMLSNTRRVTKKVVILISDGATTGIESSSQIKPYFKRYVEGFQDMSVTLITIGVALQKLPFRYRKLAEEELRFISSEHKGTRLFYEIKNFADLLQKVHTLVTALKEKRCEGKEVDISMMFWAVV